MINFANDLKMQKGRENKLVSKSFWNSYYHIQIQAKFSVFA